MKWVRWFFREWIKRCSRFLGVALVLGPLISFVMHAAHERIDSVGEWLWALVAVILPLKLGKWLWDLHGDVEEQKPLSPAEERASRLMEVADSVTGLPQGVEFTELCDHLTEKQTKKLLHLLHQTRPGERHLRDVLAKV